MITQGWDELRKNKTQVMKVLKEAGLSPALAQLRWASLTKSDRIKIGRISKGKGWHEEREPVITKKGIQKKAPEHHKAAIKKSLEKTLRKPIRNKEVKPEPALTMDTDTDTVTAEKPEEEDKDRTIPKGTLELKLQEQAERKQTDIMLEELELTEGKILYSKHNGKPFIFKKVKKHISDKGVFGLEEMDYTYLFENTSTGEQAELFKEQVLELLTKDIPSLSAPEPLSYDELKERYLYIIWEIERDIEDRNPKFYLTRKASPQSVQEEIQKRGLSLKDLEILNLKHKEIYERQEREEEEQEKYEIEHGLRKRKIKTGLESSPSYLARED